MSRAPANPKIYHVVHIDHLSSILESNYLFSDYQVKEQGLSGTAIGMEEIKDRRLATKLKTHPSIAVGECVPFYFCPRSVMLFVLSKRNHLSLNYRGGQEPIIHLEADLRQTVEWAQAHKKKWVFTLSNAGSAYFEERSNLDQLDDLSWDAIEADNWAGEYKEYKQAEFLVQDEFPFSLVERIGVYSEECGKKALFELGKSDYRLLVEVIKSWYY